MATWVALVLALTVTRAQAATPEYRRLSSSCPSCVEISNLLETYSGQSNSGDRMQTVLSVASSIHRLKVSDLKGDEQKRAIYYALHGAIDTLDDDFDSQSVVELLRLRPQAPAAFDYVFNRLSLNEQKNLFQRMGAVKRRILPKAQLPTVKEITE